MKNNDIFPPQGEKIRKRKSAYADILSAAEVLQTLEFSENALVSEAILDILALPAGLSPISQVAEIRPSEASNKQAVIDLKRMRSVAKISAGQEVSSIKAWTGAEFVAVTSPFAEISTERLLLEFTGVFNAESLNKNGKINLPDPPADLILSVNDKTVWTNIGPVKLSGEDSTSANSELVILKEKTFTSLVNQLLDAFNDSRSRKDPEIIIGILKEHGVRLPKERINELDHFLELKDYDFAKLTREQVKDWLEGLGVVTEAMLPDNSAPCFKHSLDISQFLQDEINSGKTKIAIKLKAAFACKLSLNISEPEKRFCHDVIFPAQAYVVEVSEECLTSISLPLPASSNDWQVEKIDLTVAGGGGDSRIYPAIGPKISPVGELLLDCDHSLAARLLPEQLKNFNVLEGIRIPLKIETEGSEIIAQLRKDSNGNPGELIDNGSFIPQAIDGEPDEKWYFLELSAPVKIASAEAIWLEIYAIRGRCWWQLGEATEGVLLHRGVPGGPFTPLSITLNKQDSSFHGRLRIKGKAAVDRSIPAIKALQPGTEIILKEIASCLNPLKVSIDFDQLVTPSSGQLDLPLIIHAPGAYTFSDARIVYKN